MKQRILLIVAMLLVATPAFAAVTINVTQGTIPNVDVNKLTVRYTTGGEKVRAFALDFTFTNGGNPSLTFSDINDFNRGESNKPSNEPGGGGYGIFPGQFALQIDPVNPNWYAQYYSPAAPPNDVDSNGTGMGQSKMIVELGTLYKDSNAPGTSGTLFTVRIDPNSGQVCSNLAVTVNAVRGGVVLEDGSSVAPTINTPSNPVCLMVCPAAPATITYPDANGTDGKYQVSWSAAADATGYKLERSADGGGSWTQIYAGASTAIIDDVNTGSYKYRVCSTKADCDDSAWTTGSNTCVVTLCFAASEPNMASWKKLGKPLCWCQNRQCHGNADNRGQGKSNNIWVYTWDLDVLLAGWNQTDVQIAGKTKLTGGGDTIPLVCADFGHTGQGKNNNLRVYTNDLDILLYYWNNVRVPAADCPLP